MKPVLIALVLALAQAVSASAATAAEASLIDQAREKMLQRQPREAIDLYLRAIEEDRFDLPRTAPALVDLVACFQLLKDDPASAERYRQVSARLLAKPPALDGVAVLALDAAEEDLLWKPWPDAAGTAAPLIVFTVDSAERRRGMRDGVATSKLAIQLKGTAGKGMPLTVASFDFEGTSGQALAVGSDGAEHASASASLSSIGGDLTAQLTFSDVPAAITRLKRLSGTMTVTQRKEWELKSVPLREGERLEAGDAVWRILSVAHEGGRLTVSIERPLAGGGDAGASTVATASAGGSAGGETSDLWIEDAQHRRSDPGGCSSHSDGRKQSVTMSFADIPGPLTLATLVVTKSSTRPVPFAFDGVDLP